MRIKAKRYIWILLAVLAVLLCGCGEKPAEPVATAVPATPEILPQVRISELMASNKSTVCDEAGMFPDWLELHNYGSSPAELTGFTLSDGKNQWQFPQFSLGSGEYVLIFCSEGETPLCTDFSLSSTGETVSLISPAGSTVDSFTFPEAASDMSLYRDESGTVVLCSLPTPGFENSAEGYAAFQSAEVTSSPLLINEVMTYNEWHLPMQGEYHDLVEFKNVSSAPLLLSDYYLSDSGSERNAYRLPETELAPGELYVLQCSDEFSVGAPFSLNSESEELFLSYKDGTLCDYACLRDLRFGGSYGRRDGENGYFFFDLASPGSQNTGGERSIAVKPSALEKDGVFNGVESVSVELSAPGQIYYTLDGSLPDSSATLYTQPIVLTETTVVRAVSIEAGRLNSPSLDLSYIINENHDLPVVSLVAAPDDLFGAPGIYSHPTEDWERLCSVALFDGEQGFFMEGGMKMHGATSRVAQSKKSFKINFRPRYDGVLNYDLFENGVTEFSSVLLRSAQEDAWSTQMKDILMHKLAAQMCPSLPTQDYKYCVLYINGEYWGVYAFREAHSEAHYANHYGYTEESIDHWKEIWPSNSNPAALHQFLMNNNMALSENYAHVAQHLHIESFIAWNIIECYSGNLDVNSPNVRYYYSTEDDQMRYALVDLDLGMYPSQSGFEIPFWSMYAFSDYSLRLLNNPEYCEQFLQQLSEYLNGVLSNENVLAEIDALAEEIRSEIPRDYERWGGNATRWEEMIENYLKAFVTCGQGRTKRLAQSITGYISVPPEKYQELFGNLT